MNTRDLFEIVYPVPHNVEWRESSSMVGQYVPLLSSCDPGPVTANAILDSNRQNARWEGFKAAIKTLGVITGDGPVEEPVLREDGRLHEFVLPGRDGHYFRCGCGCNVFHKPDKTQLGLFQCNACENRYTGEKEDAKT